MNIIRPQNNDDIPPPYHLTTLTISSNYPVRHPWEVQPSKSWAPSAEVLRPFMASRPRDLSEIGEQDGLSGRTCEWITNTGQLERTKNTAVAWDWTGTGIWVELNRWGQKNSTSHYCMTIKSRKSRISITHTWGRSKKSTAKVSFTFGWWRRLEIFGKDLVCDVGVTFFNNEEELFIKIFYTKRKKYLALYKKKCSIYL